MEPKDDTMTQEETWKQWERDHRRGKIFGGLVIVAAGFLYLAKELGADLPPWLLSWKTAIIAIGLITGVKHRFANYGWLVITLIGTAFLIGDIYPDLHLRPLVWPIVVIVIGLFIIFKPRTRHDHHWKKWQKYGRRYHPHYEYHSNPFETHRGFTHTSTEDYIDSTVFMGAVQKNIISKDFKGGSVTVVFGGTELNLSQADFTGEIALELTQVFGGAKLIIPPTWEIKSELVSVMGSIEDKRPVQPNTNAGPAKVLVLRGTVFMGGIDIKSY